MVRHRRHTPRITRFPSARTWSCGPSHYRRCGVSSVTAWASTSSADGAVLLRKCWQKWGWQAFSR